MPWQQYVADVATEQLEDGRYAYQVVVVSVPRQSGKTTLLGALLTERCISQDNHGAFYTAQTGKDARDRWNDLVKLIQSSPLRLHARARRSQGNERVEWPNGSALRVFAPTADSLHGYTPPTVCLDEAFAHSEEQGDALMGAIGPAQITLPHRQLWIVSTRGTATSVFLQRWLEAGRAGADGVALFDWGADDDQDPFDPDDLLAFHPALGLEHGNGITVESILAEGERARAAGQGAVAEFIRAYGNRTTQTLVHTIPPQEWRELTASDVRPQLPPGGAPMVLTYDVAHDRTASTIGATWLDGNGHLQHKLVKWAGGTSWVADQLADYCERWDNVVGVAADDTGPSREVTDQLRGLPSSRSYVARNPRTLSSKELTVAWGELLELVRTQGFTHDGSPVLADAAACVVPRPVLDSAAPSRRYSPGDIAPLVQLLVGLYVMRRQRTEPQLPVAAFA
jgi:hypothetical protein